MSANFDDPKSPAFVACRSDLASYKVLAEPMFPVVEESLTQLAAGPPTINVALASLEQLWLGRTRIYAPSVGVTVLDPSVFAFILTAATDECRINGELGRRESIGVAVPRSPLVETVAALQGVDADDVVLDARSFEVRRQGRGSGGAFMSTISTGYPPLSILAAAHRFLPLVLGRLLSARNRTHPCRRTRTRTRCRCAATSPR